MSIPKEKLWNGSKFARPIDPFQQFRGTFLTSSMAKLTLWGKMWMRGLNKRMESLREDVDNWFYAFQRDLNVRVDSVSGWIDTFRTDFESFQRSVRKRRLELIQERRLVQAHWLTGSVVIPGTADKHSSGHSSIFGAVTRLPKGGLKFICPRVKIKEQC